MILLDIIKDHYTEYIDQPNTVFHTNGDLIVICKLPTNSVTDENRDNIYNKYYAKYNSDRLKILAIFNKFLPLQNFEEVTTDNINYKVLNVIGSANVCINYYKSIDSAFGINMNNKKTEKYKLTGKFVQYLNNGHIAVEGNLIDGIETGLWKYYNNDCKIIKEINYKPGNIIGKIYHYYPSGNIKIIFDTFNHTKHGKWISYYNNINKQIAVSGYYYNGTKHNYWIFLNEDGKVYCREDYNLGMLVGQSK